MKKLVKKESINSKDDQIQQLEEKFLQSCTENEELKNSLDELLKQKKEWKNSMDNLNR